MKARRTSRARTWVPALPLLVVATAASLGAQAPTGLVRGTVVAERSGQPIPGALVALDAGIRVSADEAGRFVIADVREGPYRIAAVAPGCHTGLGEIEVVGGKDITVRLLVPLPRDVEERLAGWTLGSRSTGDATRVVTREDIRKRRPRSVQDAVRLVAPEMVGHESSQAGGSQALVGRRSATVSGSVQPLLVVDGVPMPQQSLDALSSMNVEDIERIEVSKGAAGGWSYGNQGANGVIKITTRAAASSPLAAETPPERCSFTFPG